MSLRVRLLLVMSTVFTAAASVHSIAQDQDPGLPLGRREIAAQGFGLEALRLTYAPGERSVFHTHRHPRLVVVVRGGRLTSISHEGIETPIELPTGTVAILAPTAHAVRNDDKTTIELIELEVPVAPPTESPPQRHE